MNIKYLKYDLSTKISNEVIKYKSSEKSRLFIYQLPSYGNIGDQAIAFAMLRFLRDNFKGYEIIENRLKFPKFKNISNLKGEDKIILIGGGNFGDLYLYEMWFRNYIIKHHPNCEIIVFPVSIFYENEKSINNDSKYYSSKKVKLMLREKLSYEFASKYFKVQNILTPDIVNYLTFSKSNIPRKNIGVLKRSDKEAVISFENLKEHLDKQNINATYGDNHVDFNITSSEMMEKVVINQFEYISGFSLLITDRLHGMIFAYVTKTPVIVLGANIKIKESYELWYKEIPAIHFVESVGDITTELCLFVSEQCYDSVIYDESRIQDLINFISR